MMTLSWRPFPPDSSSSSRSRSHVDIDVKAVKRRFRNEEVGIKDVSSWSARVEQYKRMKVSSCLSAFLQSENLGMVCVEVVKRNEVL